MPPSRSKYRRTTDLYTEGEVLRFKDDNVVFLRALNPLERQEALNDAAAARARIIIALEEIDSDEMAKVRGGFYNDGRAASIQQIIAAKTGEMLGRAATEVRDEEEWREKMRMLDRSDELKARDPEDIEQQATEKIQADFVDAVNARYENEREAYRVELESLSDEALLAELRDWWKDRRGADAGENEFRVTEVFYAARCCDATRNDDGWDHSGCAGHQLQLYETKSEVATLPEPLLEMYFEAMRRINMTVREAKNLARLQSSSGSSLQPSAVEDSTPSTPDETPSDAPGTSTPQYSTP